MTKLSGSVPATATAVGFWKGTASGVEQTAVVLLLLLLMLLFGSFLLLSLFSAACAADGVGAYVGSLGPCSLWASRRNV
jgi:hypothetical protein